MADEKRQGADCRKRFRQFCFLPFFYMSVILLRYGFQQDNFSALFSFGIFLFWSGCKSRIVCRRRSRSYSDDDKSLTRLPPTPSTTCLPKPKEKCTPACRSKLERQTSYLIFFRLFLLRWLLYDRFITLFTIWLYGMQSDFLLFIRICLFAVYLHLDAVFTVSHPLVVPVQAQR